MSETYHFSKETLKQVFAETMEPLTERVSVLEETVMKREEVVDVIKDAILEGFSNHDCFMSVDEKAIIRDVAYGGKIFKRSLFVTLAGGVLLALGWGVAHLKGLR
jgi:t-SNARE complex subunit (syntaxin)